MNITRYLQPFTIYGASLLTIAMSAQGAPIITYNTNDPGTGFGGTSLTLNSTMGPAATLEFFPNVNGNIDVPSNLNYGTFVLRCALCSTRALGIGAFFNPFMFDLIVTSVTDSARGRFAGFSDGGMIYHDASPITLDWLPLELGPGTNTNNPGGGSFGSTVFQITPRTHIVAPNSGRLPGETTVQGEIFGASDFPLEAVPEPASMISVGLGLLALGAIGRRRFAK